MRNGKAAFTQGYYDEGWMKGEVRDFGNYVVAKDMTAPVITPQGVENWSKNGKISFKLTDADSGIKSWHATIDDEFALFEYDGKNALLTYTMDKERIIKNQKHRLNLIVTDNCGNQKLAEHPFYW